MDYLTLILGFGSLAFLMFVFSAFFAWKKKPKIGLLFGCLELAAAAVSSAAWMDALRVSGKIDWFLLGLLGYSLVALIFISMFVVGIGCVVVNFRIRFKRPTATGPAAQD